MEIKLLVNVMVDFIQGIRLGTEDYLCDVRVTDSLLESNFDLVLIEGSYLWIHGLLRRFNDVPKALLTTCAQSTLTNSWNHAPNLPSVLPGLMVKTNHREAMPFYWRLFSTVTTFGSYLYFASVADGVMARATSAYVADHPIAPTSSFGMSDIWLTNADFSTDVPRPYLPNTVMVGGLSIEEPKPLSTVGYD